MTSSHPVECRPFVIITLQKISSLNLFFTVKFYPHFLLNWHCRWSYTRACTVSMGQNEQTNKQIQTSCQSNVNMFNPELQIPVLQCRDHWPARPKRPFHFVIYSLLEPLFAAFLHLIRRNRTWTCSIVNNIPALSSEVGDDIPVCLVKIFDLEPYALY